MLCFDNMGICINDVEIAFVLSFLIPLSLPFSTAMTKPFLSVGSYIVRTGEPSSASVRCCENANRRGRSLVMGLRHFEGLERAQFPALSDLTFRPS